MKSLLKIIRRYSLTVGLIIFVILFCNVGVFIGITYIAERSVKEQSYGRSSMEQAGKELCLTDTGVVISEKGLQILENTDFVWARRVGVEAPG